MLGVRQGGGAGTSLCAHGGGGPGGGVGRPSGPEQTAGRGNQPFYRGGADHEGNKISYFVYVWIKAVNREDKRSRRYRDRHFAKFERSRRYRDR